MADAHGAIQEPPVALHPGSIEVAIDIYGKEEASSPQSGALAVGSGTRRRHKTLSPSPTPTQQQLSVVGNNIGVLIDTTVNKVEEAEALPPIPLPRGSQGGDVELGPVNAPEEEPMFQDTGSQQGGDNDEQGEQAPPPQIHAGAAGGLPAQTVMTLIGNKYLESVGRMIALIGLGTITSTIGGFFTRGPPAMFIYFFADQHWDADGLQRDARVQRDAVIQFYACLPAFFFVGLLELCYGIWVSRDQLRAGKRAKTIFVLSGILFFITVCFTGAGLNI